MTNLNDVKRFLDMEGIEYEGFDDYVVISNGCEKYHFEYLIRVAISEHICGIHIKSTIVFPNLTTNILEEINEMNMRYRYYKFFVLQAEGYNGNYVVGMSHDFDINESTSVGHIMDKMYIGTRILEDAYPKIQRQVWR